jgi:Zn-dependent protease with chaperone function
MTRPIAARGFGPGLPDAGAPVTVWIAGDRLRVDGWLDMPVLRKSQMHVRRQDQRLLLEWNMPEGPCALSIEEKVGSGGTAVLSAFPDWIPAVDSTQDRATHAWLWGSLGVIIGLPLLVLALLFSFRHEVVDVIVARIPVAGERLLADELWTLQRARLRLIEATAANRLIEEVGTRLSQTKPTPYTYHFHLADEPSINAFALPAGHVVVHRGLIENAQSAEEVAGVMAHEIEHVEQRHSLRALVQSLGFHAVWLALTGDLGSGMAGEGVKHLAGLHFSREQEVAADAGGHARLVTAGIDPHGMVSFFETLAKKQIAIPDLLSSHPASVERSARLHALVEKVAEQKPLEYDWVEVQASLRK